MKNQKIFIILVLLSLFSQFDGKHLFAQCTNWIWANGAGGSADDMSYSVCPDAFGNVYVAGYYNSDSIFFGSNPLINSGSEGDVFLAKYDVFGNIIWSRTAIGTLDDKVYSVTTDASGNIYIVGGFKSPSINFGSQTLVNLDPSTYNIFIVKYDLNGNVIWALGSNRTEDDYAKGVVTDASGNVYVTGDYYDAEITFGSYTLTNRGKYDVFCLKLDPNGNVLWAKSSGGISEELSKGITSDIFGNVYITGFFSSPKDTIKDAPPILLQTSGGYDAFLIKYNATGNVIWARKGGSVNNDHAWGVTTDTSGNIYMTGEFESPSITFGSYTLNNNGLDSFDMFLVKYNNNGTVLWAKSMGGTGIERGRGVTVDIYGNVFVTGEYSSSSIILGTFTLLNVGQADLFLIKYDGSGNIIWAKSSGGTIDDAGFGTASDPNGYVYVVGRLRSSNIIFDSDTVLNNGLYDMFIGKIGNVVLTDVQGSDAACYGDSSGAVDLTVYGGTVPYQFSWSNSDTTEDLNFVPAGQYIVTVTDSVGCSAIDSITLNEPLPVIITHTHIPTKCFDDSTGSIDITVSGGYKPYSFSWSNGQTTDDLSGIPSGTYIVTVTDDNNCIFYDTVIVTSISDLSISLSSVNDSNNNCTGEATVTVTGGTLPYTFLWNDPSSQTIATATNLCAGTYVVIVTDSNGCQKTDTVTITDLSIINLSLIVTNVTCYGDNDGSINVSVSGGRLPYNFSWSNGATSKNIFNLSEGKYVITVTDFNGTTIEDSAIVSAASAITINYNKLNESCTGKFDGSIDITVTGGVAPYIFNWSNGDNTEDLNYQTAGSFVVTVIDSNNCSEVSDTITITTNPSPSPGLVPSENSTICEGDSIPISVDSDYAKYSWSSGDSSKSIFARKTGTYKVIVFDVNGCEGSASVSVNVIPDPAYLLNSKIEEIYYFCPSDSTGLFLDAGFYSNDVNYLWLPNGDTNRYINIFTSGSYSVTVSVQNCYATDSFVAIELCSPLVFIPNSFTPNDDGINDTFYCEMSFVDSMGMTIFNKWGEIIFQQSASDKVFGVKSKDIKWDGTFQGDYVHPGFYFYIVNYINRISNGTIETGSIRVLR